MEVDDRDFGMEDADCDILPGVFSFDPYPFFANPSGDSGPGPTFSQALVCVGDGAEWFEMAFVGIGAVWVIPKALLSEKAEE